MRSIRVVAALLCLANVLSPLSAFADQVSPGTRIRLTGNRSNGSRVIGSFLAADRDSIWLAFPDSNGTRLGVGALEVSRLELSRGRQRYPGRDALGGLATGVAFGLVIGASSWNDRNTFIGPRVMMALAASFFGLLGFVVGGVVGMSSRPVEQWREAPIESLRDSTSDVQGTR